MDYGFAEALTTYGLIGLKCWIYKGDIVLPGKARAVAVAAPAAVAPQPVVDVPAPAAPEATGAV